MSPQEEELPLRDRMAVHLRIFARTAGSSRRRLARPAALLLALALAAVLAPAVASAATPTYSEAHRFGSFDSTWYDGGAFDGQGAGGPETAPAPGKFVQPAAFAVDTNDATAPDGTAVYVLDRTGPEPSTLAPGTPSQWRLQKLSDTGAVLGVASFALNEDVSQQLSFGPVSAIAVDHQSGAPAGTVYLLVRSGDQSLAQEVIAFSTATTTPGKLDSPAGLPADTLTTPTDGSNPAGLLSTAAQLDVDPNLGYPSGLAIAGTGAGRALAISGRAGFLAGPAAVDTVALTASGGVQVGDVVDTWSSDSLASDPNAPASIARRGVTDNGLSSAPDGSLTVLLSNGLSGGTSDDADVIKLNPTLSTATILASAFNNLFSATNASADLNAQWAAISLPTPGSPAPGSQVVPLSDGHYAALFLPSLANFAWHAGSVSGATYTPSNYGIRLLGAESAPGQAWDGTLSNPDPPVSSILNTLGNTSGVGACAISLQTQQGAGGSSIGLAAGKDGAVWVLIGGQEPGNDVPEALTGSRRLIELTPGSTSQACSQPSATSTFGASVGGRPVDASGPITVPLGTTVDFDGSALDYGGGTVSQYQWDFDGNTSNGYDVTNTATENGPTPLATASHQFTTPGPQTVSFQETGDFGVVQRTAQVIVQASTPPQAAFTASSSSVLVGQTVSFDGSGSSAADGTHVSNYHWDYGDGVAEDSQTPQIDHSYAAAGTYTVTLTVRGSDNQVSTAATQQVTVTAPSSGGPGDGGGNGGGGGGGGTPGTGGGGGPTVTTPPPAPRVDQVPPSLAPRASGANGVVTLALSCPTGQSTCVGTVRLQITEKVKVGKGKKAKTKTKVVTVGSASFSLATGQKKSLVIKLNHTGSTLLRKSKSLKLSIVIAAHNRAGRSVTTRTSTTVKPAKAKKKAKKK